MRCVRATVWVGWPTTSRLLSLEEKRLPGNEIFYKDTKAVMESPSCSCPWCSFAFLNGRRGRQGTRLLWMQWNSGSCKSRLNKRLSGMTWLQLVMPWGQVNGLELFLGVPVSLISLQFLSLRFSVFRCSPACHVSCLRNHVTAVGQVMNSYCHGCWQVLTDPHWVCLALD